MAKRESYLVTSAGIALIMSLPLPAMAQTAPADRDAAAPQVAEPPAGQQAGEQDVIVTGSRLRSPTLTAPAPVQVIDSQQIQREGYITVIDAIQNNPTFGNPSNSRTTSNGSRQGLGGSTVGLRNGGDTLTLTLIEGRRSVSKELAFIPTGFVDRVEVLTGGASAVYGSDAIIGVVNFIYKKNFEGVLANVQAGISEQGDNQEYSADLTVGSNFANDRGNAMFYVGWSDQAFLSSANRDYTARSFSSLGVQQRIGGGSDANLQAVRNLFVPVALDNNPITGAGLFVTRNGGTYTIALDGTARAPLASEFFDGAPYGAIASPLERLNTAARINYQITDNINLFAQGTYARSKTRGYGGPLAHQSSSGQSIIPGGAPYNIESRVISPTGVVTIVRNPFVPDAIYNSATDTTNATWRDGLRDITFQRRALEWGGHNSELERDGFQLTFGADGKLGGGWRYEAYYSYGEATQFHTWPNGLNADRYAQALNVIPDIFDVNGNGNRTEAICADAAARAAGCIPINIFAGTNGISQAAVDWTKATGSRYTKQTLADFQANISGPLFQLWSAGPVEVVAGVEHRRETELTTHDPLHVAGRNGFDSRGNAYGSTTIKEAYGEVQIPLIHNTPFIENLTIRAAGRASKYRQLDKVYYGWNVGFEWSPISDIRFRGTKSYAIRAPTIDNLTRPQTTTFDAGTRDVCIGVTTTSTTAPSAGCRADPLVMANITANGGVFTLSAADRGNSIRSINDPNPNLGPQFSNTLTFGAVINPTSINALRNLILTADFYKVDISGGIGTISVDVAGGLCYVDRRPEWCALFTRRPEAVGGFSIGTIDTYSSQLQNGTGKRLIEGLDFTASYMTGLSGIGLPNSRLSFQVSYSHLLRSYSTPVAGAKRRNLKSEMGTPDDPWSGSISYEDDVFGLTLSGNYVPRYYHEQPFRQTFPLADGSFIPKEEFRIPPRFYTNMQMRFKVSDQYQLFFGVRNLLDVEPIVPYAGIPGTYYVYDQIGRRFYAGLRLKM
ncbi:TonB-dependent receptor [Sphingomonas sp. BT-65]|uniref:TonB-dependent receptor domain-containing protein n=1 Tax=Sphingomonas sp. BT-65 TaxID=2989821 RepID=UPI002235FBC2|nr:TonB-dependent receptor [Sphingomonas sp. BT-65]MCW4462893.1 TonB-dependent receptor [Sphingomonas sp. BT-65]